MAKKKGGKQSDYIKLNASQKDEIRRLTQLANRRIKNAHKAYAKEGMDIVPKEIVGKDFQLRENFHTKNTPLSRSVKFESQKEYRKHLNFLRSFETSRPGIKEYTASQREKTVQAVESSLGTVIPDDILAKLHKLSAPKLGEFWNRFSDKSSKLGLKYSSEAAVIMTITELYEEDLRGLSSNLFDDDSPNKGWR